jgi:Flavin containing amine oxidoreductase.
MSVRATDPDLAIVGAGAAGTYVSEAMLRERPDWSIALFERSDRIGGRVRSKAVPGLDHPIELGGMRYLTSHARVAGVVERFGIATHPFGTASGPDRFVLRGVLSNGAGDPAAGSGYALATDERGRSAGELIVTAFERIVPSWGNYSSRTPQASRRRLSVASRLIRATCGMCRAVGSNGWSER